MSFSPDFGEQLDELSSRNQRMDELLAEAGRDPAELRRSVNLFDAQARAEGGRLRYYDDEQLLADLITSLTEAGYGECGLYYPSDPAQEEAFERIAREVIPTLR